MEPRTPGFRDENERSIRPALRASQRHGPNVGVVCAAAFCLIDSRRGFWWKSGTLAPRQKELQKRALAPVRITTHGKWRGIARPNQPRSGERIQPTAQAVGDTRRMTKPRRGERSLLAHDRKRFNAPHPSALAPPTSSMQTQSERTQNTPAPYTENHPHMTTTATAH